MINRYPNISRISVDDDDDDDDNKRMHYEIQQLVKKSPLEIFGLWFEGSLFYNDDAFEIMKEYNQII